MNKELLLTSETLGEKIVRKGFRLYFFTYIGAPAGYLTRILITNSVSVSDLGVFYSVLSLLQFINIYNDLGLTESLKFFLPKLRLEKQYNSVKTILFFTMSIQVLTSFLFIVFLFFGADYLAENYFQSANAGVLLKFFCLYFLGINIFQVIKTIFFAFQDTFRSHSITFVQQRSTTFFTLIFFLYGTQSLANYAIARTLGLLAGIFLAYVLFSKYKVLLNLGKLEYKPVFMKEYVSYAFRTFLSMNSLALLDITDQQMVLFFLGPDKAGLFSNYLSIHYIIPMLVNPLLSFMFPVISSLNGTDRNLINLESKEKILSMLYNYFSVFSFSLGVLFFIVGPILTVALFGIDYSYSGYLLLVSSLFIPIQTIATINIIYLSGIGKIRERFSITISIGILNILLNLLFLKYRGLEGVVISTVIGRFGFLILTSKITESYRIVKFDLGFIKKNILATVTLGLFLKLAMNSYLNYYILDSRWITLVSVLIISFLYYSILVILNKSLFFSLLKKIKK